VSLSLASNRTPSNVKYSFIDGPLERSCNRVLYESLRRPRLDRFIKCLKVLALYDRLSSPVADSFRIIDEISATVHRAADLVASSKLPNNERPFGIPLLNADDQLGLSIVYYQLDLAETENSENRSDKLQKHSPASLPSSYSIVYTIRESPKFEYVGTSKYGVRYSKEWLDSDQPSRPLNYRQIKWNEPEPLDDAKAEFVLKLNPPVLLPESISAKLDATLSDVDENEPIAYRRLRELTFASFSGQSYLQDGTPQVVNYAMANVVPCNLSYISEIPIQKPADLPEIIQLLRANILIVGLLTNLLNFKEELQTNGDDIEFSFADVLMEADKLEDIPLARNVNINIIQEEVETSSNLTSLAVEVEANSRLLKVVPTIAEFGSVSLQGTLVRGELPTEELVKINRALSVGEMRIVSLLLIL
jgi:hypothetical protein